MGRPIVQTVSLVAAVANGIALSQALGAAGNLTLNGSLVSGGVATLDSGGAARRVVIHSVGDDSTLTWTIAGTKPDPGNSTQSIAATETLAGANAGDAVSLTDFLTVIKVSGSQATAGNVTAGTNGTGSGPWVPWDNFQPPFMVSVSAYVLSGAPEYQLDVTYDDVYGTWLQPGQQVVAVPWPDMQNKFGNAQTCIDASRGPVPVRASRLTLIAVGAVRLSQMQQLGII